MKIEQNGCIVVSDRYIQITGFKFSNSNNWFECRNEAIDWAIEQLENMKNEPLPTELEFKSRTK